MGTRVPLLDRGLRNYQAHRPARAGQAGEGMRCANKVASVASVCMGPFRCVQLAKVKAKRSLKAKGRGQEGRWNVRATEGGKRRLMLI